MSPATNGKKPPRDTWQFIKDLGSEFVPSALKKGRDRLKAIGRLLTDPRAFMEDQVFRKTVSAIAFVGFAVSVQWLLGQVLGRTGHLVQPTAVTINIEEFAQQFPEESRDSIRCNLQALAWIEQKTSDESNTRWFILAELVATGSLMTTYLKLRFLRNPQLTSITFGQYLQFAAYSLGICLLTSALLQTLFMLLLHNAYAAHENTFFFWIAFASFVLLPIWHYGRLLQQWKAGRVRKIIAIAVPYLLFGFIGITGVYLCICAYVCDRM